MSPRTLRAAIGVSSILLTLLASAWAEPVKLDLKMGPIEQSRAYQLFKTRTPNELSKLIFLIDRFKDAKIKFVYEGIEYPPSFVARLARWFLSTHYHGEKSTKWIMLWCNKSFSSRQLIWVRDEAKRYKLSREIFLEELAALEKLMEVQPEPVLTTSSAKHTDSKT